MNSPSQDIATLLDGESTFAFTLGTDLFVGSQPARPFNSVTLFDALCVPAALMLPADEGGTETARIQIRVRNVSYANGYALAHSLMDYLHGLMDEVVGTTSYDLIKCVQGPALLDWDANNCARFIMAFEIKRRA